jgi:hypothetical protein
MRKFLRIATLSYVAVALAWFVAGIILFPDGVHVCGSAYCGKQGQPHTRDDFERFEIWQTGLMFGWPLALIATSWLNRVKSHPSPNKKLNVKARENVRNANT